MPTDDYIKRSDALSLIVGGNELIGRGWLIKELATLPAADVEPVRHGRWVKAQDRGCVMFAACYAECSECHGIWIDAWKMRFYPGCGAKMTKEEA